MRPCTEDDRLFRDFIEDVSVTSEELAAIVRTPELSIPEVKRLRAHPSPGAQTRLAGYAAAVRRALSDLVPLGLVARLHPFAGARVTAAEGVGLDAGPALSPSAIRVPMPRNHKRQAALAYPVGK